MHRVRLRSTRPFPCHTRAACAAERQRQRLRWAQQQCRWRSPDRPWELGGAEKAKGSAGLKPHGMISLPEWSKTARINAGHSSRRFPRAQRPALRRKPSQIPLANFDEDYRNVVDGRAFAPCGDAVEQALLHFGKRQERSFAHEFLNAGHTKHLTPRIKYIGDAVRIEYDAVTGVQIHVESRFDAYRVGKG